MSMNHTVYSKKFSTDLNQFAKVAMNTRLGEDELRVFMFLSCRIGSTFPSAIDVKRSAETLDMKPKKFKAALKNLEIEGVITQQEDEHSKKGYRMSYTGSDALIDDYFLEV